MKVLCSSETSITIYKSVLHNIPQNLNQHQEQRFHWYKQTATITTQWKRHLMFLKELWKENDKYKKTQLWEHINMCQEHENIDTNFPLSPTQYYVKSCINTCMQIPFSSKKSVTQNCFLEVLYLRWNSTNSKFKTFCSSCSIMLYV